MAERPADGPRYLAVIPARGGSKRIPGKNLAPLRGLPLLDYTVAAARGARSLTVVMVSTDSETIAQHARGRGAMVPALRPAEMASDSSPTVDAIRHAAQSYCQVGGKRPDAIVVLQPTSPFRTGTHIDEAIALFESSRADTVTSVRPVDDHPFWAWRREDQRLVPFFSLEQMAMDRHLLPEAWAENGAIYVLRTELVLAGVIYGERVVPYVMDARASVDIDTPDDLAWAEFLLTRDPSLSASCRP